MLNMLGSAAPQRGAHGGLSRQDGGTVTYAAAEGPEFMAVIEERRCVDSLSGSLFAYSVEVRSEGRSYSGCAAYNPAMPAPLRRRPMDEAERLREMVGAAKRIVAFTGAGISTKPGIPDFRSPGGIWTRYKPIYFDDFMASDEMRRRIPASQIRHRRDHAQGRAQCRSSRAGHAG